MKTIPLTQGKFAIVDDADYDELIKHKWWFRDVKSEKRVGYAARSVRVNGKKKAIHMHRQVMGLSWDTSIQVDHIDGNGLNNQRHNLRICNNSQNHMNQKILKNNTTGYMGVYYEKRHNSYVSYINVNKKRYHVGAFKTFEEAKTARINAEIKHFGEFRRVPIEK